MKCFLPFFWMNKNKIVIYSNSFQVYWCLLNYCHSDTVLSMYCENNDNITLQGTKLPSHVQNKNCYIMFENSNLFRIIFNIDYFIFRTISSPIIKRFHFFATSIITGDNVTISKIMNGSVVGWKLSIQIKI